MKIILSLFIIFFSCIGCFKELPDEKDVPHCDYTVAVEYVTGSKDTLTYTQPSEAHLSIYTEKGSYWLVFDSTDQCRYAYHTKAGIIRFKLLNKQCQ